MTALVPLGQGKFSDAKTLAEVSKVGDYLPRVQVMGSQNDLVKEGKFPIGHFALIEGRSVQDLTEEFDAIVLAWRPKAMQFAPEVISIYDPSNPEFVRIKTAADEPKSQSYGYGPEYLMFLPDLNKIVTFFVANVSGRLEAPNVSAFWEKQEKEGIYLLVTFNCILAKNKKQQSWHTFRVSASDRELTVFPDEENLKKLSDKFNNPKDSEIELIETSDKERER